MGFADNYFKRHSYGSYSIQEPPSGLLCFCVVIPVYLEEKLEVILKSLKQTKAISEHIEVILVFNYAENASEVIKNRVLAEYSATVKWTVNNNRDSLRFHAVLADNLPARHAGVGLARKIGMDLALKRLASVNCSKGIIMSLDADTTVDAYYFRELSNSFYHREDQDLGIVYFEHPVEGNEFPTSVYQAVVQYELYLRYYKHILNAVGFRNCNYTIGSCFGVRAESYARYGGMNRHQAGEDFYFLNKLFPHVRLVNLTGTCVYPSSRPSDRVVFGTGPVIQQLSFGEVKEYYTYSPESFRAIQKLIGYVPKLFSGLGVAEFFADLPDSMVEYLMQVKFTERLEEIKQNTATSSSSRKRFFLWFDGFQVVKYLNYAHTKYYQKIPVARAVNELLISAGEINSDMNAGELLNCLRRLDKNNESLKLL